MELRHLRYFVAVAEELHFGRAARRLHISQPPLSQQIRALEQEAGAELLSRVGRRVEITAAGKEFLNYARAALAQVAQGVRSAQRIHSGELGQISVGFITSMSYTYLPWVLRAFRSRHPQVELVLSEQNSWEQIQALQESRLHVGILRSPFDAPALTGVTALSEPFVAVLSDNHRLARTRALALKSLSKDAFIMFPRSIGGHFYARLLRLFHDAGFMPVVAQEAAQMHVAVGLVSAGIGVALVPASLQLLQMSGVVYRPLIGQAGQAEISIARRAGDAAPVVRAFTDVAVEVISGGVAGVRRRQKQ